jgi:alkanesulfonate monooxygenase SsuD/methylene tetrahydromethanopterin reductase-like flavin-dependent oxidoreductase (luciferase family)
MMKFGMFGGVRTKPGEDDGYRDGYGAYIDGVVEAEALGYYSNFIVEHHFSGVGQVSASMSLLSFIAARTSKIRLGTAVVVIPWHNPVLVAEQAATLDLLSNGRFDFGVGRGYRHMEFAGFCIPIAEANERFEEAMTIIRTAWSSDERFSHHGKHWRFEDIMIEPPPTQSPHPPLWLAAGRPESLQYTAANGYDLLLDQFQTFDVIIERLNIFKQAMTDAGRTYDPLRVGVARALMITNSAEERAQAIAARIKHLTVMNSHGRAQNGGQNSSMVSDDDLRKAAVEGVLLGTPDEIIEKLKYLESAGVGYVLLSTATQDLLRTFAREVMPHFA